MERIYLDNAATTRVRPEVAEAVLPAMMETYGNASSVHSFGREPKRRWRSARAGAAAIGAVNTVVNRDGKLYGYNTDYTGFATWPAATA